MKSVSSNIGEVTNNNYVIYVKLKKHMRVKLLNLVVRNIEWQCQLPATVFNILKTEIMNRAMLYEINNHFLNKIMAKFKK